MDIKHRLSHKLTVFALAIVMMMASAVTVSAASVTSTMTRTEMLDLFYPVGSYYQTSNGSFDPNTQWGGTWVKEEDGRVLIAANSTYAAGTTGGEATHILTPGETALRSHSHTVNNHTHSIPSLSGSTSSAGAHTHVPGNGWTFLTYNQATTGVGVGELQSAKNTSGSYYVPSCTSSKVDWAYYPNTNSAGAHTHTISTNASNTGGSAPGTSGITEANGAAHNNMQPYKAVYRWRRTG